MLSTTAPRLVDPLVQSMFKTWVHIKSERRWPVPFTLLFEMVEVGGDLGLLGSWMSLALI